MNNSNTQDDPTLTEFIVVVGELVKDFTRHAHFPRLRIPPLPIPLDPISDHVGLDPANDPHSISRNLFRLEWDSLSGYSSLWHLHALRLASGERAYWVDDANGRRIVAVGPSGAGADANFSRALFASNGEDFKASIIDSAPSRISTSLRGDLLIDLFRSAFSRSPNASGQFDRRSDVRFWLEDTLTGRGKELRPKPLPKEQAQHEFLARVEGLVSDFTLHPEEPGVGVPRRFTPLYAVAKSLRKKIDPLLRSVSRSVFQFVWFTAPGITFAQDIGAMLLPDGRRVFWFYLEADDNEENQFYVAGTAAPEVTDLRFLQLLFKDNGKGFGVETCGCAPSQIFSPLDLTPELVDLFVDAFDGFPQAWNTLDDYQQKGAFLDPKVLDQGRQLVERWLKKALR